MRNPRNTRNSPGKPPRGPTQERNPFSGNPMNTAAELDQANMDYSGIYPPSGGLTGHPRVRSSNDGASYQDHAEIQAWAAGAGVDQFDEYQALDGQNRATISGDGPWSTTAPQMPGNLSHSNSSDGSDAWNAVPMQRCDSSMFDGHASGVTGTHLAQSLHGNGLGLIQSNGCEIPMASNGDDFTVNFDYPMDPQPYPSPVDDEIPFALATNEQPYLSVDDQMALDSSHGWPTSVNTQELQRGLANRFYQTGWIDGSVDPSASSSQSSQHPDTPLSIPQDYYMDEGPGARPPLAPEPLLLPYADPQSTLRPVQGHRKPVSELWTPPQVDLATSAYGSPVSMFTNSRRSSDVEPLSARRHPLYQAKAREDGLYQCVYADDGKACDHEPFKLKCNYDKHLDSHLKPYRCKQPGCAENPFSSTACLLRHEREAHGMHNHKEVLCEIQNCERSVRGKGFPRKWNAHDHMKRVHHYTPPEDSNSGDASSPSASSTDLSYPVGMVVPSGKKRVPSPVESTGARRTKANPGKSARGVGISPSAQQNSRRQMPVHSDAFIQGNYHEISGNTQAWPQWQ